MLNSAVTAAIRLCSVGVSFVLSAVAAAFLSVEQFGLFTFWLSLVNYLAVLSRFGLDKFSLRNIAGLGGHALNASYSSIVKLQMGVILCFVTVAFMVWYLLPALNGSIFWSTQYYFICVLVAVLIGVLLVHADVLRGKGNVNEGLVYAGIVVPSMTILLMLLFDISTASHLSAAYMISLSGSVLVILINLRWKHKIRYVFGNKISDLASTTKECSNICLNTSAVIGQVAAPVLILGFLSEAVEVGKYQLAFLASMTVGLFQLLLTAVFEPRYALAAKSNRHDVLERELINSLKVGAAFAFFAILCSIFFVTKFQIVFFDNVVVEVRIGVLLILSQGLNLLSSQVVTYLVMTGRSSDARNITFSCFFITVFVLLFAVGSHGAFGAGISVMMGMIAKACLAGAYFLRNHRSR